MHNGNIWPLPPPWNDLDNEPQKFHKFVTTPATYYVRTIQLLMVYRLLYCRPLKRHILSSFWSYRTADQL